MAGRPTSLVFLLQAVEKNPAQSNLLNFIRQLGFYICGTCADLELKIAFFNHFFVVEINKRQIALP
jgi:hypothetical protein